MTNCFLSHRTKTEAYTSHNIDCSHDMSSHTHSPGTTPLDSLHPHSSGDSQHPCYTVSPLTRGKGGYMAWWMALEKWKRGQYLMAEEGHNIKAVSPPPTNTEYTTLPIPTARYSTIHHQAVTIAPPPARHSTIHHQAVTSLTNSKTLHKQ